MYFLIQLSWLLEFLSGKNVAATAEVVNRNCAEAIMKGPMVKGCHFELNNDSVLSILSITATVVPGWQSHLRKATITFSVRKKLKTAGCFPPWECN